jgi:hypothetical protein
MADSLITIEDIMSISETLLPEFDQEMATTRRLLERVPGDSGAPPWRRGAEPRVHSRDSAAQAAARHRSVN